MRSSSSSGVVENNDANNLKKSNRFQCVHPEIETRPWKRARGSWHNWTRKGIYGITEREQGNRHMGRHFWRRTRSQTKTRPNINGWHADALVESERPWGKEGRLPTSQWSKRHQINCGKRKNEQSDAGISTLRKHLTGLQAFCTGEGMYASWSVPTLRLCVRQNS